MQEDNSHLHNYVYSSEMVDFVTICNACCRFLEELTEEVDGKEFIEQSVKHLSSVYAAHMKLEETEPVFESSGEPTVTEQDWSMIFRKISMLLGPHNNILRPAEEDEFDRSELVIHTISEDMADVYQELRDFTSIYSRGMEELMNDAAWELREHFAEHWGKKLLRSLMALHDLYIQRVDPTEKE
jgi:hypothetical protein